MKYVFSMTLALALLASAPALAEDSIDVMTQNQYLGADLTPVITAEPEDFNQAVIDALKQVAFNDIESRADALAALIAARLPAIVGLQEVFEYWCTDLVPFEPDEGCDNPDIRNAFPRDHLGLTLAALEALGESYSAVATVVNFNTLGVEVIPDVTGIPFYIDGSFRVVNFIDRDVILVRGDIAGEDDVNVDVVTFGCLKQSGDGCNYDVVASATLPGGVDLDIERGFVGVDVTVEGKDYRFINTHLEVQHPSDDPRSPAIQAAQAQELILTLANTPLDGRSLIVVGDINSSPEDLPIELPGFTIVPPYAQFIDPVFGGVYTDAWDGAPDDLPGFSCCQGEPVLVDDEGNLLPGSPLPGNLLNHKSNLDERIDVIFSIEMWNKVKKARVLGAKVSDKTAAPDEGGLWPSDHASVAAELQFDE
jgi:hypothetical protein